MLTSTLKTSSKITSFTFACKTTIEVDAKRISVTISFTSFAFVDIFKITKILIICHCNRKQIFLSDIMEDLSAQSGK